MLLLVCSEIFHWTSEPKQSVVISTVTDWPFGIISKFVDLNFSVPRNYYYKNLMIFGDLLHRIHPLAGQGFNMTLRDIKEILRLIDLKIENGLDLDTSIFSDFEKNMRHKNYLFLNGIDFIYEFFNFENITKNNLLSKSVKFLGKNKMINQVFTKFADNGLVI